MYTSNNKLKIKFTCKGSLCAASHISEINSEICDALISEICDALISEICDALQQNREQVAQANFEIYSQLKLAKE